MGERVRITDVSPRDGLQNEPGLVPTRQKAELVRLLAATGVDEVEVTSFVSARWIPQLGDARELLEILGKTLDPSGPTLSALVPNEKGLLAAIESRGNLTGVPADKTPRAEPARLKKVSLFTAASESFSRKNTNASIAETLDRFRPVASKSREADLELRGYVSCAIACPYEGPVDPARVGRVAARLAALGVPEIDLGDTIGAGTPENVTTMLRVVRDHLADQPARTWITLHLHDTFGRAADCVRTALDLGVRSFDGSVAGLGGCPYASSPGKPAPGNIDTHLLVRTIHQEGYETSVDLDALARAAEFARRIVSEARAAAMPAAGEAP